MARIDAKKGKEAGIIGIMLLALGLADLVLGVLWVKYAKGEGASLFSGTGLWSGALLGLNGALGVLCWIKHTKLVGVFFLVLAILNIIISGAQAAFAYLGWVIWKAIKDIIQTNCTDKGGQCVCLDKDVPIGLDSCDTVNTFDSIFLSLLIINGIATILAFSASIVGCTTVCCSSQTMPVPAVPNMEMQQVPAPPPVAVAIGQ
ncbi:uncharacterized protein LOC116608591 isoform X2 [Nematostella vectensis]|nr:uncharacterized protein LOC116608591 isoform X2 [Nematostella vectensis]